MRKFDKQKAVEVAVIVLSAILGLWLGLFAVKEMQKEKPRREAQTTEKPR